ACAQGAAFMGELVSFFSISTLFNNNKWAHFGFTTVAWIGVHTIDGLIVILFNKELRNVCEIKNSIFHSSNS
uniref:7TM_GPCR_Srx domain-containing protein n=1 Tax=Steinernema glaseri TaxID=37863 RepID=A0A1I8AME6_9BILA